MIIIPDVHGRDFWEKPVKENLGKEHIVFLGDYLDPYEYEGIAPWEVFPRFEEIIALKRENPEGVTLLLGNHDLHYIDGRLEGGRYDYIHDARNKKTILDNASLFQMACGAEIGGKKFLFTHAGVMWGWLVLHKELFDLQKPDSIGGALNALWTDVQRRPLLLQALADIPYSRWGRSPYGSPVWSDVEDMSDEFYEIPNIYQIYGHSQQETDPVIGKHFASLDCHRSFRLTEDGNLQVLQ